MPTVSGEQVAQSSTTLAPVPQSAGAARRFVAQLLAGRDPMVVDVATLLVSEVVTNALLHAHTDIEVRCRRFGGGIHVSVRDSNPLMPARRVYAEDASTGRGLGLVEALATTYGVLAVPGDGKVVWFTVDPAARVPTPADWAPGRTDEEAFPVALLNLPIRLLRALQAHNDALLRECALRGFAETSQPTSVQDRLARAEHAHAGLAAAVATALHDVDVDRTPNVDVVVAVPVSVADDLGELTQVLDSAEALATDLQLLTRPALPELRQLYSWCTGQVTDQRMGGPQRPWEVTTDWDEHSPTERDWDDAEIRDSAVAGLAADDSNHFIAVNDNAAALLGWSAHDLVGRRIVTIIPPRLRDAHVAGFTRIVDSGTDTIIGTPVRLPALRRDGTEIECEVTLQHGAATGGRRQVFVAWLRPV
jgi:PAS domain S-box-containing protein